VKRISSICHRVLSVGRGGDALEQVPLDEPTLIHFFFDIDATDHNGVITHYLANAIETNSAIVTSQFIFHGTHQKELKQSISLEKMIKNDYDIYYSEAFVVFVPKRLGETEQARLQKMDLNPDSIQKITLAELWKRYEIPPTFEGFKVMFKNCGEQQKLIHIAGHGGINFHAGMSQEHYLQFLKWLKNQRCQGLYITSCYSGGKSAMVHPGAVSFPVIVRSIGDFYTYTGQQADKDTERLLKRLASFWSRDGKRTARETEKLVSELEQGITKKTPTNLMQVYFPLTSDSPGWFRALGESGIGSVITYASSRLVPLKEKAISISGKETIAVYPINIQIPIEIQGCYPVLLSQIPGTAHHVLKKVILKVASPLIFLQKNFSFYKTHSVGVDKLFYIESLECKDAELQHLFMSLKAGIGGWKQEGKFYLMKLDSEPREILEWEYLIEFEKHLKRSVPDQVAVKMATGGLQDNNEVLRSFEEFVRKSHYYPLLKSGKLFIPELELLIGAYCLSDAKKLSFIALMLPKNEELVRCALFEKWNLSPDAKDEENEPVILHAAKHNCFKFTKFLLEKGADPNATDSSGLNSVLTWALTHDNKALLNLLLEHPKFNPELKDKRGRPYFFNAHFNLLLIEKILYKNPKFDINLKFTLENGKESSLLLFAIEQLPLCYAESLLQAGANVNQVCAGRSPLTVAIQVRDYDKTNLLLKSGADPYQEVSVNNSPVAEAMRRHSLYRMTQLFLRKSIEMEEGKKEQFLSALYIAAIESGEVEKIRFCQHKGAKIRGEVKDVREKIKHC
jgi:ankyrin repeat protein